MQGSRATSFLSAKYVAGANPFYMPFGSDWWPYTVRRIGENPSNGLLLARSLFS
jgi:proline dehydrogenase